MAAVHIAAISPPVWDGLTGDWLTAYATVALVVVTILAVVFAYRTLKDAKGATHQYIDALGALAEATRQNASAALVVHFQARHERMKHGDIDRLRERIDAVARDYGHTEKASSREREETERAKLKKAEHFRRLLYAFLESRV